MTERFEVCIVGCGPAGAVLAAKLAEAGVKVAVLERGPRYPMSDRTNQIVAYNNNYSVGYNEYLDPKLATLGTYKHLVGVGGTALHWGGESPRPNPDDFKVKTRFGIGKDWPIAYDDLEPWLLAAEHELGISGGTDNPYAGPRSGPYPMPAHGFSFFDKTFLLPAFDKLGWKGHSLPWAVNSVPYQGRSQCQGNRACASCPSGARYSADYVHAPRFEATGNVKLFTEIVVRRLETSSDGSRIVALHASLLDGTSTTIVADRFVLAAGGVETPRLLMLSAAPHHPDGLGNAGGQLGRNYHDHGMAWFNLRFRERTGSRLGFATAGTDYFRSTPRDRTGTFSLRFLPHDWTIDGYLAFPSLWNERTLSLAQLREAIPQAAVGWSMCELVGTGTVTLDHTKTDYWADPVAKIEPARGDWNATGIDASGKAAEQIASAMGAIDFLNLPDEENGPYHSAHPTGACSMATSLEDGVCDPNLRVFGLDNLYLASSAAFPHGGAFNPTLTIVALSLRLADHLLGNRSEVHP